MMSGRPRPSSRPSGWMPAVGDVVDYHSIMGGPVTRRALVVVAGPSYVGGKMCVWLKGKAGCVSVNAVSPAQPAESAASEAP